MYSACKFIYSTLALLIMCFLILFLLFQSCRMKVQECQRKGYYHVGFIDPYNIHEESVRKWPNRAENNILRALHKQNTCQYILLPYNFEWVLYLFFYSTIYMWIYIQNFLYIYVYETSSTGSFLLSRSIDAEFGCTTPWGSQHIITKTS